MPFPNKSTQFKKGQSGNPKGRRAGMPNIKEALEKVLSEEKDGYTVLEGVIMKLRQMAFKGDMRAIQELLDRAYGKPKQSVDSTINTGKNLNIIVTDPNAADNLAKLDSMLKAPPPEEPEDDD